VIYTKTLFSGLPLDRCSSNNFDFKDILLL
jgi:hypothetical protein